VWTVWRLAFLLHTGLPVPAVHDEFSYLLGADTFAHGRLANPPHPLASFFESAQELARPTYASKYPPGQAMFLALGQVVFGAPFYGVLIGNALMLFTFCMMLFVWAPARWAVAVSVLFGLVLSPGMYWTNSYWGGSVATSGGALVLLAIGLCRKRQMPLAAAIFALGALLLFWTRPYEGGVFTLMVLIVFARELWQKRRAGAIFTALSILAIGGVWTCYDNEAVTGNPFLLPHLLHQRQYDVEPIFWFQRPQPQPTYSQPRLAAMHGINGPEANHEKVRTGWHLYANRLLGPLGVMRWDLGSAIVLMVLIPLAWGDPVFRKMALVAGVFLLAVGAETFHFEHYTAPVWAALALMIAIWAQRAWNLRLRKFRVGAVLVLLALVPPVMVANACIITMSSVLRKPLKPLVGNLLNTPSLHEWSKRRAALIDRLSALDRPQLVIVRYPAPDWRILQEWVYNSADIDRQRVVFALDLGAEKDQALLNYYPGREAQLLTFDPVSGKEEIQPYPSGVTQH
jgi:hypothetical protein